MKTVKTLIIDPDNKVRNMLTDLIDQSDGVSFAGSLASHQGSEIKELIQNENPDVIILGINELDSTEMKLFEHIRKEYPKLPVIIMPPHSREGAQIALYALKKGAVEYITKTVNDSGSIHMKSHFTGKLIPVLKAVPRLNRNILLNFNEIDTFLNRNEHVHPESVDTAKNRVELLVIAGCLGGVASLYTLLSTLPEHLSVPVIVVQHMPKIYTEVLAEDLNRVTPLNVIESKNNIELKPGHVYLSPGGTHSLVKRKNNKHVITLQQSPKVKGHRPSIDMLLQSTQAVYGDKVMVVYLSGGGKDGIEGAKVIDIVGGQVILQNKNTSLLPDLPWKIEGLGIDEGRYPLERLGSEIAKRVG